MTDKKIVIDLRWVFFPVTLCIYIVYAAARLIGFTIRAVIRTALAAFMLTGLGYLVVKAFNGVGWDYTARRPTWKGDAVKFKMRRSPRWAFLVLGHRSELYTVVGGPSEFFVEESAGPAPAQKLMRGLYARFLHEKPEEPILENPAPNHIQIVPIQIPTPAPQRSPYQQPYNTYQQQQRYNTYQQQQPYNTYHQQQPYNIYETYNTYQQQQPYTYCTYKSNF